MNIWEVVGIDGQVLDRIPEDDKDLLRALELGFTLRLVTRPELLEVVVFD